MWLIALLFVGFILYKSSRKGYHNDVKENPPSGLKEESSKKNPSGQASLDSKLQLSKEKIKEETKTAIKESVKESDKYSLSKLKGGIFEKDIENRIKCLSSEFVCFTNFILKDDKKSSEIDLLVLHPNGVVSIECKNYNAFIAGKLHYNKWFVYYGKTNKYDLLSPVIQNSYHINRLLKFIPESKITNLVVFSNSSRLCDDLSDSEFIIKENEVDNWFKEFLSRPRIYSKEDLDSMVNVLLANRSYDLESHLEYVENFKSSFGG